MIDHTGGRAKLSNAAVFLAIAENALAESERLLAANRRPNGAGGYVVKLDPGQRSFKQALVALVFAGIYFEALAYAVARMRFSKERALEIDREPYPKRAALLGVEDEALHESLRQLQADRKGVVHEKALFLDDHGDMTAPGRDVAAQDAARVGVAAVRAFASKLLDSPAQQASAS